MRRALAPLLTLLAVAPRNAAPVEPTLLIGIAARISPYETYVAYGALLAHIGERLGRRVEMVQYSTYAEMDAALERRDLDFAFVGSRAYVRDHARFGVELLAAPQVHGQPFYYALLIVPAGGASRSLADLRGKRFAFTDPLSNSGRLAPAYIVEREFGLPAERFFGSLKFTGSHDRSIDEVNAGRIDGASVESLIFDYVRTRTPEKTKNIRILAQSPPYGIPPFVANRRADASLKGRIRAILLGMNEDPRGKRILDAVSAERFIVPNDSNYDSVREMEAWLAGRAAPHPNNLRPSGVIESREGAH
jgi:phosphonate transport system substrate-binding protein